MRLAITILSLVMMLSCKTHREIEKPPLVQTNSDSTTTKVTTITDKIEKTDSTTFSIPEQKESHTVNDSSYLENDFANSTAKILPNGGGLFHNLNLVPQDVKVEYRYIETIVYRDSFIHHSTVDSIPYPVEVPVEVEKEFTRWERMRMDAGLVAIAMLLGIALWKLWKLRKKIIPL